MTNSSSRNRLNSSSIIHTSNTFHNSNTNSGHINRTNINSSNIKSRAHQSSMIQVADSVYTILNRSLSAMLTYEDCNTHHSGKAPWCVVSTSTCRSLSSNKHCSMEKNRRNKRRRPSDHNNNETGTSASSSASGCSGSKASSDVSGKDRDVGSPSNINSSTHTKKSRRRRRRSSSDVYRSNDSSGSLFIPLMSSPDDNNNALCALSPIMSWRQKAICTENDGNIFKTYSPVQTPSTHSSEAPAVPTPWVCNVAGCGARFRKKAHAERHAAVHTAERPYSCLCCSASFKRSEHLRRHCLIVHRKILPSSSLGCVTDAAGTPHSDMSAETGGATARAENGSRTAEVKKLTGAEKSDVTDDATGDTSDPRETAIKRTREVADGVRISANWNYEKLQNTERAGVDLFSSSDIAAAIASRQKEAASRRQATSAEVATNNAFPPEGPAQTSSSEQSVERTTAVVADAPPTAVQRPFVCGKCGRTFVLKQHLTRHMKSHVGRYACRECDAAFAKKQQLRLHLLEHLVSRVAEGQGAERERTESAEKKNCETQESRDPSHQGKGIGEVECVVRSSEDEDREKTMLSEAAVSVKESTDNKRKFLCPHQGCDAVFSSLDRLYVHLKRVSRRNRDYECETCGEVFLRFSALVAHRRTAHPANVHVCPLCSKRYSRVTRLREHIRVSSCTRRQPMRREEAQEVQEARHDANVNSDEDIEKATADGPSYLCPDPVCGLVFATRSNMRAHYRVKHMQLREFKCEKCDASFGFKAVLRRHVARVHGRNLENSVSPSSKESAGIPATTQLIQTKSTAKLSSKRTGDSQFSTLLENRSERHLSFGAEICDCGTRREMRILTTADSTLSRTSGLSAEELPRRPEQPAHINGDDCSGSSAGQPSQEEEEQLQHCRHCSHEAAAEDRVNSAATCTTTLSRAHVAGNSGCQLLAEVDADCSAGERGGKGSCCLMFNKRLTCDEWIVDAVQLNLLSASADSQV